MARKSDEDILSVMVNDAIKTLGKGIAGLMGPAPGMESASGQKELAMWNYRIPDADPTAMVAQGMGVEEALGHTYPFRLPMIINQAGSDVDERVGYAKEMARRSGQVIDTNTQVIDTTANEVVPQPAAPPQPSLSGIADEYKMGAA